LRQSIERFDVSQELEEPILGREEVELPVEISEHVMMEIPCAADVGGATVLYDRNQKHPQGVLFRVWAPNAEKVSVAGDWNKWNPNQDLLRRESDGIHWRGISQRARPGEEYKYVLEISDGEKKRQVWRNDPRGEILRLNKQQTSWVNVIYDHQVFKWTDDDFERPSLDKLVLYQVHVGSFSYSGCSKQIYKEDKEVSGKVGTFRELTDRLDYLADMGINGIALLPITQDVHIAPYNCWGYDPVSLFALHTDYGTPDDLKQLINTAHSKGISVFFDMIANHLCGKNILNAFDGKDIYFPEDESRNTDWGPRFNFSHPRVQEYILDAVEYWLRDYHFDGVRMDSTGNIRAYFKDGENVILPDGWALLQRMNDMIASKYPDKITIAEDLMDHEGYINQGGIGFQLQWDEVLFRSLLQVMICPKDSHRDIGSVCDALLRSLQRGSPSAGRIVFTENHDTVPADRQGRIPAAVLRGLSPDWPDCGETEKHVFAIKRAALALALIMTSPGTPMMLQGQEIFETCALAWPYGPAVDWDRAKRLEPAGGSVKLVKDLITLRRNLGGVTAGLTGEGVRVYHRNFDDKVIAYHRWLNGGPADDVIIVANFSNTQFEEYEVGFPRAGEWHLRFQLDLKDYSSLFRDFKSKEIIVSENQPRDGYPFAGCVQLGTYSLVILSQNRTANLSFKANCSDTNWGDKLLVVGNAKELGNWNLKDAITMKTGYSDARFPIWKTSPVPVVIGEPIEFKLVKLAKCFDPNTCPHKMPFVFDCYHEHWETRENHTVTVNEGRSFEYDCHEPSF